MNRFMEFMTRRVAGVPIGVIAVLVAAGLLYMAVKMPKAETEEPEGDENGEPFGDGEDVSQPVFSATPVLYQPSGVNIASSPQADTNALWGRRVQEWLVGQGASVDVAAAVVYKYLNGEALSATEISWRDKAVKQFGYPPEDVDYVAPIPVVSPTTPGSGAGGGATPPYTGPAVAQGKPPLQHVVKGKTDNQATELARLYYGTNSADAVNKIKAANARTLEPYRTGIAVKIPEKFEPQYFKATAATKTVYDIARKNGVTVAKVEALNPGMKFPVKPGIRVRVR